MKASTKQAATALVAALALATWTAPTTEAQQWEGRSRIELQVGASFSGGTSTASVGNIHSEAQSVGALGAIAFSHWLGNQLAVTFSVGASAVELDSRVGGGHVSSRTAVVSPIMGGVRYYFPMSEVNRGFRPYLSLTAGPVFGTESHSSVGGQIVSRSVTRTAFGTRAGAGFDVPFGGSWSFGVFGGYCLMSDFSTPIGSQRNHSAPDLGFSIGWMWGGRG